MVPANKILTVAYGTFSCTLEGFDDPFSTMTDIAEYFRDLAADDRFFGAEPPTPDMAMLRTIAEARAKHAVTAQPEEGGVTLRPSQMPAAAAMTAAFDTGETTLAPASKVTAETVADVAAGAPVDEVEPMQDEAPTEDEVLTEIDAAPSESKDDAEIEAAIEEAEIEDDGAEVAADEIGGDSVAAKLARIRGVVEADRQAASFYAEDEHADDMMSDEDDMADDTLAAAFEADALDEEFATEDDVIETDHSVAETAPITSESEDTLASDLAAILSDEEAREASVAETAEDEAADDERDAETATIEESPAEDRLENAAAAAETDLDPQEEVAEQQPRRIRVRKVRRVQAAAEAAAAAAKMDAEETLDADDRAEEQTSEAAIEIAEATTPPVADAADTSDEDEDELMAELAAIEAELTRDATGDMSRDTADEEGSQDPLADLDDEDDLMAELAAIRAEDAPEEDIGGFENEDDDIVAGIMDDDDEDDEAFEDELAAELSREAEVAEEASDETVEEASEEEKAAVPPAPDMERLFAATDSRLSGEDTSRRHANISHLKAAVAARRADGPVEPKDVSETDAYRADLASTVRPRRKSPTNDEAPRTPRPERPAPLVLVSEQRVEESLPADAAPVQPRRAPRTAEIDLQEEALAGAEDFEAFAADVGASELSDILEAAAVYSCKVMGQDNFSRPRLLHLAAEAVEDMSREDGLRGFGQLLRDGTIRKVSRGTFALATDSRYAEEAERRAG